MAIILERAMDLTGLAANWAGLAGRVAIRCPMEYPFLKKDFQGRYTLDDKVVDAVPVGERKTIDLDLNGNHTKREIKVEMTWAAFTKSAYRKVYAVYIMGKNGTMEKGKDTTWYQPMMIKYE